MPWNSCLYPELTDDDSRALVNYFKEHTAVNVVDFRTI